MRLLTLSIILLFSVLTHSTPLNSAEITTFAQFKLAFNKSYPNAHQELQHRTNFYHSLKWIQENQGKYGAHFAINELSDLGPDEFQGAQMDPESREEFFSSTTKIPVDHNLPAHFDWREHVQFQFIEHQLTCGACWAFAALSTIETAYTIKHGIHVKLSKQELVDCTLKAYDHHYKNNGCIGGFLTEAFKYVKEKGVFEQQWYPYRALKNETCYSAQVAKSMHKRYFINDYHPLTYRVKDEAIMSVIKKYGPVAADIYAHNDGFKHYKSGIVRNLFPNSTKVTHAVAVIGWGSENGVDYWIVRNSWGTMWGEHGYGRIERHHNLLGINNYVSFPVLN